VAWYKDGNPLTGLYMPFEGGPGNALLDLSGNSNTVTTAGTTSASDAWNCTAGHDGTGAFEYNVNFYLDAKGNVSESIAVYNKAVKEINAAATLLEEHTTLTKTEALATLTAAPEKWNKHLDAIAKSGYFTKAEQAIAKKAMVPLTPSKAVPPPLTGQSVSKGVMWVPQKNMYMTKEEVAYMYQTNEITLQEYEKLKKLHEFHLKAKATDAGAKLDKKKLQEFLKK